VLQFDALLIKESFHLLLTKHFELVILQGSHCGIYGANCPEWIITMEVKYFLLAAFDSVHSHLLVITGKNWIR